MEIVKTIVFLQVKLVEVLPLPFKKLGTELNILKIFS